MARLAGIRRWLSDHHLQLTRLDPGPRRLLVAGLVVGGLTAAAMVVAARSSIEVQAGRCPTPTEATTLAIGGSVVLVAVVAGLGLLAVSERHAPPRLVRTRVLMLLTAPLLLVLTALSATGPAGPGWVSSLTPVRVVLLFVALEVIVITATIGSARGLWGQPLPLVAVLLSVVGSGAALALSRPAEGACMTSLGLVAALGLLGFFALLALPVLMVWVASKGLQLSGDLATWALGRLQEERLLAVLLAGKFTFLLLMALLVATGHAPGWLQPLVPSGAVGWLIAIALVMLVLVLLTFESRLVGSSVDDFVLVTRGFALLVSACLVVIPLIGVVVLVATYVSRPPLVLAVVVSGLAGVVSGLLLRRRPSRLKSVASAMALAVGLGLMIWAVSTTDPMIGNVPALDENLLALLLGLFLLAGLAVVLLLMLLNPALRRPVAFLVGLSIWVGVTLALPSLAMPTLTVTPAAVDVVLTVAIAVLALCGGLGWQRSVSAYELVLLLVTCSVIIEVPLLLSLLPVWAQGLLLVIAFFWPTLEALTVDAPALNTEPAARPVRTYAVVGLLCIGYGLLTALALVVSDALDVVLSIVDLINGVAALPFAVILVAVMSASRQREAPPVPDG